MTQPPGGGLDHAQKARMYQLLAEHDEIHATGEHPPHEEVAELHALVSTDPTMGPLLPGRIPLNKAEHAAVDKLAAKSEHADAQISLTRRDPGNTGPVVVHVDGIGEWHIDEHGKAAKQKAAN